MQTKELLVEDKPMPSNQLLILLVDDDEDEHDIFLSALNTIMKDFTFLSAKSCEEALKILHHVIPDYVFLDVNMPRLNGIDCLKEIKKVEKLSISNIYIYSTGINTSIGKKAIEMGAVDFIVKPASLSSLTSILKTILL